MMQIPKKRDRQVRAIFAKLRDKNLPYHLIEQILGWLVTGDNDKEKDRELSKLFKSTFHFSKPDKEAYRSFNTFVLKYGLQDELQVKSINKPFRKSLAFKIAAVTVPVLVLAGVYKLIESNHRPDGPVAVVQVSVPAADGYTDTSYDGSAVIIDENSVHTLPDNSIVRLGKGSRISHAPDFSDRRHIELDGEAHFNVTKAVSGTGHFTIHTDHLDIKVLGTDFDIHSPAGDSHSIISLYHGSIEVEAGGKILVMKPAEHLRYDHITKDITVTPIPFGNLRYDEMPGLVFDRTPIIQVFDKLEKEYGLRFVVEGEISTEQALVDGDLTRFKSLNELLAVLEKVSGHFQYEIHDNEIKIKIHNIQ